MPNPGLPSEHHPQYAHVKGTTLDGADVDRLEWVDCIRWTYADHDFEITPKPEHLREIYVRFTDGSSVTLDGSRPALYDVLDSDAPDLPEDIDRIFTADLEAAIALEHAIEVGDLDTLRAAARAGIDALHRMYHAALYGVRAAEEIRADNDFPDDQFNAGTRETAQTVLDALRAGLEGKEPTP